jgi:hypothetical protein
VKSEAVVATNLDGAQLRYQVLRDVDHADRQEFHNESVQPAVCTTGPDRWVPWKNIPRSWGSIFVPIRERTGL